MEEDTSSPNASPQSVAPRGRLLFEPRLPCPLQDTRGRAEPLARPSWRFDSDVERRGHSPCHRVVNTLSAAAAHALCFAGLAAAHYFSARGALVSDPAHALRLLVVFEAPLVIVVFSLLRRDPKLCSFLKAAARGLLGVLVGALINAFGAIVLGAPVGIKYWTATTYWSLLMSLFTFVPAACVFGASKVNWQNVLSHSIYCRPTDAVDYMISAPAHGAVIGAWLGAWPMPLDWERPWQEWPICVTYGSVAGHLIGMAISLVLIVCRKRRDRAKSD